MNKWITSLARSILFPKKKERIRIDPDHLPGLRPPKAAPRRPVVPLVSKTPPPPDIERMYRTFRKSQKDMPQDNSPKGLSF